MEANEPFGHFAERLAYSRIMIKQKKSYGKFYSSLMLAKKGNRSETENGKKSIDKLLLQSAAAPLFTQRDDFKYNMKPEKVDGIIQKIKDDRPAFLSEFAGMFFEQKKSPEFLHWFQLLGLEAGAHSTINSAIALRDEDLRSELNGISLPTAIFHGKKDQICEYALGEELEKQIPNSVLVPFKDSGHGINADEPERFNTELIRFLKRTGVK